MTLVGAQLARCMEAQPRIVAHIIVGQKPEPYFAAALESIADACDCVVVNDNSGSAQSINALTAAQSRLGRSGRLVLVRTAFSDFSAARNACIEATPEQFRDGWALFTDADEVHGLELRALAAVLPRLGPEVDAVDGYSRHFVARFPGGCRWSGAAVSFALRRADAGTAACTSSCSLCAMSWCSQRCGATMATW